MEKEVPHVSVPIANSVDGMVYILNEGATIDAEAAAMLQALHSRSTEGIMHHLDILAKRGAGKFMENFYVGYGHKSIGDCGTTTIFIEGVSMLAAKAVQDWPLYSGQESSTRYIDFRSQHFCNPLETKEGEAILEKWRAFYVNATDELQKHLMDQFPRQEGENEKTYIKAIKARGFDILRGFLPAGATTNLAWHTNLRQAADKLMLLRHHPLAEVRDIAAAIEKGLQEKFPHSFGHKQYPATEEYNAQVMKDAYYFHDPTQKDFTVIANRISRDMLPREVLAARPPKTELPRYSAEWGDLVFGFTLDFGSFRDLQRHRAIAQRMPLLTMDLGFEEWYISELPEALRERAKELLSTQKALIDALDVSPEEKQYYMPMGYKLSNRLAGSLGALVYMVELRATRFVHATLRKRAVEMAQYLEQEFGADGLVIHLDDEPDRFDVRRGTHDIELKE